MSSGAPTETDPALEAESAEDAGRQRKIFHQFSAEIRAIMVRGVTIDPWAVLEIERGTMPSKHKSDGHAYFRAVYPEPRRIPAAGLLSLFFMDTCVAEFRYGEDGSIPTVRSATIDAINPTAELAGISAAGDRSAGFCRAAMPEGLEAVEADFAGYSALPAEKWVQLNTTSDAFTVQVRLRKMPPADAHRDMEAGVYYVYGVDSLVIHHLNRGAPASDAEKALLI